MKTSHLELVNCREDTLFSFQLRWVSDTQIVFRELYTSTQITWMHRNN